MSTIEFITKKPIAFPELLSYLKELKKEQRTEFQDKLLNFAKKNTRLSLPNYEKLIKELVNADILGLSEEDRVTIANILPRSMGELKAVLSASNLNQDAFKKIFDIISKYASEKIE